MVFCNVNMPIEKTKAIVCHNPYFNRWFSAIGTIKAVIDPGTEVTILILIDGFLQSRYANTYQGKK